MEEMTGFDCSEPTPRVNYKIMQMYVGRKVRVVCKVEDFSGETIKATTSDKQTIFIKPKQGSQYDTAYVEIEGVVENNMTIQEDGFTTFGDDFGKPPFRSLALSSSTDRSTHCDDDDDDDDDRDGQLQQTVRALERARLLGLVLVNRRHARNEGFLLQGVQGRGHPRPAILDRLLNQPYITTRLILGS